MLKPKNILLTMVLALVPWFFYGQTSIRYNKKHNVDHTYFNPPEYNSTQIINNNMYTNLSLIRYNWGVHEAMQIKINTADGTIDSLGTTKLQNIGVRSTVVHAEDTNNIYYVNHYRILDSLNNLIDVRLDLLKINRLTENRTSVIIEDTNVDMGFAKIINYHEPGKFLAAGGVKDADDFGSDAFIYLIVFDTNGVVYKRKRIDRPGQDNGGARDLISIGNKNYVLVGNCGYTGGPSVWLDDDPCFVQLDSNLEVITIKDHFIDSTASITHRCVWANEDGSYFVGGTRAFQSDPYWSANDDLARIMKLNNTGDTLWSRLAEGYKTNLFNSVLRIKKLKNNNYLGVGQQFNYDSINTNLENSGQFGLVWKFDSAGNTIWQRKLAHPDKNEYGNSHSFLDFVEMPNGDIVAEGYSTTPTLQSDGQVITKQVLWIVRTDSMGCTIPDCHLAVPSSLGDYQTQIEVWPNPAQSVLNLQQVGNQNPSYENILRIYNLQGRLVQEVPFAEYFMSLNISNLASDAYVYTYNGASGKFVKE